MARLTGAGRTKSREKLYAAIDELYLDVHSDARFTCTGSATSTTNAAESIEVFTSAGVSIGFLAVYGDEDLTSA